MGDGVSFLSRFFLLLFFYQFYCFVKIVFKGKAFLIAVFAVVDFLSNSCAAYIAEFFGT
jgi:hypothetical protein